MTDEAKRPPPPGISTYTPEIAAQICERLSKGEPLAEICRSEGMPAVRTVSGWKKSHPEFAIEFGEARDAGYDAIAARLRRTARGKKFTDGGESSGDVQRDKLIIDTDLKLLAKWDPRRYGDRVVTAIEGTDGPPVKMERRYDLSKVKTDDLAVLEKILAAADVNRPSKGEPGGDQDGAGAAPTA